MKAVNMICNRTCTLRTTFGSIAFEKDVARLVAPQLVEAALKIGVLTADPKEKLFEPEKDEEEAHDLGTRNAMITKAVEAIIEENNPDEFTTGSSPKLVAIQKRTGLKKVGSHELKKVLDKRNQAALDADVKQKQEEHAAKVRASAEDPPDNEL
jgi:hypothetical protein